MSIHKSTALNAPVRLARILGAVFIVLILTCTALSCDKSSQARASAGGKAGADGSVSGPGSAGSDSAGGGQAAAEAAAATEAANAEAAAAGSRPLTPEEQALAKVKAEAQAQAAEVKRLAAMPVAAPVLSLTSGVYTSSQAVTISAQTKEASINYTIDGSAPGPASGLPYKGPLTISATTTLRTIAFIPGGNSSKETRAEYAVNELFVSQGGGGQGHRGSPFADLKGALVKAKALGIKVIKLSSGTYTGSVEITSPMTLSGGWQASFLARSSSPSIIKGDDFDTSSKQAPAYAIKLSGAAVNAETRVEGLEFNAGEASYTSAVVISDGATPVLVSVRAVGGFGSYGYGAVVLSGANPVLRSCTLSGGEGATSFGLSVDTARAQVSSSYLLAGTGAVGGYGLSATDARVAVASSVLAGNAANVSYGAAFYNCKNSALENCTIVGGKGKEGVGVFISAGDPAIVNCIISAQGSAKSYGIVDNYGDSAPSSLVGNAFIGCSGGMYFEVDSKSAYTKCDGAGKLLTEGGSTMNKPVNSGNLFATFALGAAPLFKTPADAALPAVKALAGNAATDINGKGRSEPWSAGAFEL